MSRKGQSITLSISDRDKAELENLALEFGCNWGDRPNISKLVESIARRQLIIAPNNNWTNERIKALETARKALIDLGKTDEAKQIAQLLQSRSELTLPFREEIETFLDNPLPAWRQQIDNLIHRQQPFRLSYRDAADRLWSYTVLHAQIVSIEKRQYLMCRAEESEGNQDVEGLRHNWTLRLDRIQEAAVVSINKAWLNDLETIPVEFHVYGGLAFAYERKTEDIFVSELEREPPIKRIVRNISGTFWFFREITRYGKDCVIVSPEEVRSRFRENLKSLCQAYDLEIMM
ncbi:WYL domain-containing protein [Plectonema cf. radiosum LEGE 06105]|uniref:WYL domain-containing protein n=1 Tax=Plectonema cf. radiosum LEGE 06105 TaxID=945769 RepID=A0A8J7JUB2_9CYAN|nr:WYL domain-containing protein [Plectonema radiosum]MBE9213235.1 WYL domain-containing protein [Plectonema cf. radiosum LEGE 06105]